MAYIYELTDTQTGKWYLGCRTAKGCEPEDLGVKYFTSSAVVSPLFKSDPARFQKKIIVVSDADYVAKAEVSLLTFRDAKNDPMSLNMTNGNHNYASHKVGKRLAELKIGVCGRTKEQIIADGRKGAAASFAKKVGIFAPGMAAKANKIANGRGGKISGKISGKAQALAGTGIHTFESRSSAGKTGGAVTGALRCRCAECDVVSAPGPLGMHQRKTGHAGKIKLTGEE